MQGWVNGQERDSIYMAKNKRKTDRRMAPSKLEVIDLATGRQLGKLINISEMGAMLVTELPVAPSTSVKCRLELESKVLGYSTIDFAMECRWSRKNVSKSRWESGFQITATGIDESLLQILVMDFELYELGDKSVSDVRTVEAPERRKNTRFTLFTPLPVLEMRSYRELGKLVDLSVSGIGILAGKPLRVGAHFDCRVILPENVFSEDCLALNLKCARCQVCKDSELYEIGCELEAVSKSDAGILAHLIHYFAEPQKCEKKLLIVKE